MRQTIRHEGDNAKIQFSHLVPFARHTYESAADDTSVFVNGEWHIVEIKECHANTINQVRAIKYVPLIIYDGQLWYVIPPHEVVRLVSLKSRGQHTEIPFECANLSLTQLPTIFRCLDNQLADRVLRAIEESYRYIEIKEVMDDLLSDLVKLKENTKATISSILEELS